MLKPSVSTCANPKCSTEFKRLGDGKLFTEPPNVHVKGRPRQIVWLCGTCCRQLTLRYDRERHEFVFSPLHKRGTAA
jgi:hypothetical protein